MAKTTTNLELYEKESTDSQDTFNITTMLNENWDKIDVDSKTKKDSIDGINSTIGTAILQTTDKTLKGAINEVKDNVNNIQIGGRNLLVNSQNISTQENGIGLGTAVKMADEIIPYWRVTGTSNISTFEDPIYSYMSSNCIIGQQYTISCDVRIPNAGGVAFYNTQGLNHNIPANVWTKIYFTFIYSANYRIGGHTYNGTQLDYRNWKLELGNKATDWTPAPEDQQAYTDSQIPTSLPANGGNSTTVNNKTAAAAPATTEKTDLIGMVNEVKENLGLHEEENATGAHKAKNILVEDASNHFTSNPKNVENVLAELFTSADNGKTSIYNAIVGKGTTPTSKDFSALVAGISAINTGKKFASGTGTMIRDSVYQSACTLEVTGLTFKPSVIIISSVKYPTSFAMYCSMISTTKNFNWNNGYSEITSWISSCYIGSTGFKLLVGEYTDDTNLSVNWIAIE